MVEVMLAAIDAREHKVLQDFEDVPKTKTIRFILLKLATFNPTTMQSYALLPNIKFTHHCVRVQKLLNYATNIKINNKYNNVTMIMVNAQKQRILTSILAAIIMEEDIPMKYNWILMGTLYIS